MVTNKFVKKNNEGLNFYLERDFSDFFTGYDKEGNPILVPFSKFLLKLKSLQYNEQSRIIITLRFLRSINSISNAQKSIYIKIIGEYLRIIFPKITSYIEGIDDNGDVLLLERQDFIRKIENLDDEEYINIYGYFKDLYKINFISESYLKQNWKDLNSFELYLNTRIDKISKQVDLEWKKNWKDFARSNKSYEEKVKGLVEFITDIEDVIDDVDNEFNNNQYLITKKKFLEVLLDEVIIKQKFERNSFGVVEAIPIKKETEKHQNNNETKTVEISWHPRIFIEKKHFELFEFLKKYVVNEHSDFSFIFRAMHKKEFIHPGIKESEFRVWLHKTNNTKSILEKLKLYDYCKTPTKEHNFSIAKLHYNL